MDGATITMVRQLTRNLHMLGIHHQLIGMAWLFLSSIVFSHFYSFLPMLMKILYCRCVGEVRKLAAGGGHSAVLTDACSLKELCEFRLADCVTPLNASDVEDVASRTGSDALARLCERLRY